MITWGDVVEITKCVFDIKQTQLAELMMNDKSVISRIKNGTQTPTVTNKELFSLVFDPATSGSPASKGRRTPQLWLELLKGEIESNFREVREDMEDCWDEEDYRTFVLTLLDRARRGPPTEKRVSSTIDCEIISETPDVDNDNHHKKQEEASIIEAPTEQMRKIFEQAVLDCNIASHICKLPDYLLGESFYGSDCFTFAETIHTQVLGKFSIYKCENIFKEICEFSDRIKSYSGFLGLIRLSVSEKYGSLLMAKGDIDEILSMIDSDYDQIKNNLGKEISIEGGEATDLSVFELQSQLNQLEFLHNILLAHKRICELFGEICPGKTLLAF